MASGKHKHFWEFTEEQKAAYRKRNKEWRLKNPEKVKEMNRKRKKQVRQRPKKTILEKKRKGRGPVIATEAERIARRRESYQKWVNNNREKQLQKVKEWQHRNPEYGKEQTRKRRARKKNLSEHFTRYEWEMLCKQYDYRCLKCGEIKPLSPDHVIPLSWGKEKGGVDTIDNIQPLCQSCNSSKNATYVDYRTREPIKVTQLLLFA